MKLTAIVCLTPLMLIGLLCGQAPRNDSQQSAPSSSIPQVELTLSKDDKMPAVPSTGIWEIPLMCSSDGTPFIEMAVVGEKGIGIENVLVSISKDGARNFVLKKAPGLHAVREKGFFPGDSAVAFLVNATRDERESKQTIIVANGERHERTGKFGEKHDFIVIFDRKAEYKETIELDLPFAALRIGIFPSGNFLVVGFDQFRRAPQLVILREDGTLLRLLDFPRRYSVQGNESKSQERAWSRLPAGGATTFVLSGAQLVSSGRSLLLVVPRTTAVLEVTEGGEVSRHPLSIPQGFALDSFIPSGSGWYVSLRKTSGDGNQSSPVAMHELPPAVIYEFNPQDGTPVRKIIPVHTDAHVACQHEGEFLALQVDSDMNFVVLRGKL